MTHPTTYVPTTKEWREHCRYLLNLLDRIAADDEQVAEAEAHITTGQNRGILERHQTIRKLIRTDPGLKGIRRQME